ncbi:MAG: sigma-70 family RNA polymerase sigma factor [Deltaproteobacteria bacterium]|nr:sigma-70 family RNA polymerase sigma factor [Deltaproteobacteria bacterium]
MGQEQEQLALDKARGGDREAFGDLVKLHRKRVWKVALHLLGSQAEADDVTQETFLRAFRGIDRFDGRSELGTWLYRIVVNLSLNVLRKRKRTASVDPSDPRLGPPQGGSDPSADVEARKLYARLVEALDQLSLSLRTTVVLVAIEGLAHKDVAEILGCSEGTIAWRIHQARRLLKDRLGDAPGTAAPEGEAGPSTPTQKGEQP